MNEELLRETRDIAIRVEAKLDALVERVDDHEDRMRGLEKWRWGIPGGVIAALLALVTGSN